LSLAPHIRPKSYLHRAHFLLSWHVVVQTEGGCGETENLIDQPAREKRGFIVPDQNNEKQIPPGLSEALYDARNASEGKEAKGFEGPPDLFAEERVDVSCDLCKADEPDMLFEKEKFRYVRCRRCDMVYVTPRLRGIVEQQMVSYDVFAHHSNTIEELIAREHSGKRKRKLQKEVAGFLSYHTTGHILDIGCGLGGFLHAAQEQGWGHAEGIEIARGVAEYVGRYFPVQTRPLEEVHYKADHFDIVRAHNVIEHLPSPKAMVRKVHRILRPGGLFAVSTPNFDSISLKLLGKDWPYICGNDHVYLFDPKTLTCLLKEEGFRVIRLKSKGVHLRRKDHTNGDSRTPLSRVCGAAETMLNLVIRRTLKGHRLCVWAEKI